MRLDYDELKNYPDILNKEQLRIVGHMSKRTALFLLENKLIPSTSTGKKTRCYRIRKEDIIAFFDDQDIATEKYIQPTKWYGEVVTIRKLPKKGINTRKLEKYYTSKFKEYEDVMTISDVMKLTGYSKSAITQWVNIGKLKSFYVRNKTLIPKPYLMEWLLSPEYNGIERKSKKHVHAIWGT